MKLLIVIGIVYLVVSALGFLLQGATKLMMGSDTDQTPMRWGKILKYSFQWPYIILKAFVR